MTWQEYQDAVALLYEQAQGFGHVSRNVLVPDTVTGQKRQIDVLIEIEAKGHSMKLMVDAKFHSVPIDVREVEAALALADAVGANKAVIIAASGWTAPAKTKAERAGCDLRLLSVEQALDLIVREKWMMCPACEADCIVLDQDGAVQLDDGLIIWWLAGQCRSCKCVRIHCQDCGVKAYTELNGVYVCGCGHAWSSTEEGVTIEFFREEPE